VLSYGRAGGESLKVEGKEFIWMISYPYLFQTSFNSSFKVRLYSGGDLKDSFP